MDFKDLLSTILLFAAIGATFLSPPIIIVALFIHVYKGIKANRVSKPILPQRPSAGLGSNGRGEHHIASYGIDDIPQSGLFSANERRMEYRKRGKSPSVVIDGIYNDAYRDGDRPYSDVYRDWDADA